MILLYKSYNPMLIDHLYSEK